MKEGTGEGEQPHITGMLVQLAGLQFVLPLLEPPTTAATKGPLVYYVNAAAEVTAARLTVISHIRQRAAIVRSWLPNDPRRQAEYQLWRRMLTAQLQTGEDARRALTAFAQGNEQPLLDFLDGAGPRGHRQLLMDDAFLERAETLWFDLLLQKYIPGTEQLAPGALQLTQLYQVLLRSIPRNVPKTPPLSPAEAKSLSQGLHQRLKAYEKELATGGSPPQAYATVVERFCATARVKDPLRKYRILEAFDTRLLEKDIPELKEKIARKFWHTLLSDKG